MTQKHDEIIELPDDVAGEEEEKEVSKGLQRAKELARGFSPEEIKSGDWFLKLLRMVITSYDRNARAEYFLKKYPGLPPDDVADRLISVTVRYATVAGAVAGVAVTADQVATLGSAGMTVALLVGTIGAEMLYLSYIQMRLVLDLAVVYDLRLDSEDPEDVLMIFGYALGIAPADLAGRGLVKVSKSGAEYAVRKYVSKSTLRTIQNIARRLGVKVLQRTIIKYAVPVACAAVGSTYNYMTTKTVGQIARRHFQNRGRVADELRVVLSRQHTYDLAFLAAARYMCTMDGTFDPKQKELYQSLLSQIRPEEYELEEFNALAADEDALLAAMAGFDEEMRESIIEVLILMAVYDGELSEEEAEFLLRLSEHLGILLDVEEIRGRAREYEVIVEEGLIQRSARAVGGGVAKAAGVVGSAAGSAAGKVAGGGKVVAGRVAGGGKVVAGKVAGAGGAVAGRAKGLLKRKKKHVDCPACGKQVSTKYRFCPHCGAALDESSNEE